MKLRAQFPRLVDTALSALLPVFVTMGAAAPMACAPTPHDAGNLGTDDPNRPSILPPAPSPPPPGPRPPASGPVGTSPPIAAEVVPPALSGGTLLVLRDGNTAVAADPERDAVFLVDLVGERLLTTVALEPGDEPGRVIEDGAGQVYVALRRGGAVAVIKPADGSVVKRQAVCPAPRGLAHDPAGNVVHVACAGGELVTLTAPALTEVRRATLDRDLRDVVVDGGRLLVSRFRSAEVLTVDAATLKVGARRRAPGSKAANQLVREMTTAPTSPALELRAAEPTVAWRMRPLAGGGAIMLHQESSNSELGTQDGGYAGGPCKGPMGAAVVEFRDGATTSSGHIMMTALPIDFDVSADGKKFAMVSAGGPGAFGGSPVILGSMDSLQQQGDCMRPQPPVDEPIEFRPPAGEPIAVAFDGKGRVVTQTREPARVEILSHRGGAIKLSDASRADSGHQIFHMATRAGLACASCHPEGGDDGRVWRFAKLGARRTQNLLGGIAMTAPFHWDGDMRDLGHLMSEVFTGRMAGPAVDAEQVRILGRWIDGQRALPASPPADPAAAERGRALFNDAKVACATCHKGALYTDNTSRVVGTGRAVQVPMLKGLATRAPYMHTGCAKTLMERFDPACGGGDMHGVTSHLTPAQLADLVTYLEGL